MIHSLMNVTAGEAGAFLVKAIVCAIAVVVLAKAGSLALTWERIARRDKDEADETFVG